MSATSLQHRDLFHVGVVVRDYDAAKTELAPALGVTWGREADQEVPVWLPDGPRTEHFRAVYSNEGPVRIELVAMIEGTIWIPAGAGQAHHLGYWSTDVAETSESLRAAGLPCVARVGASNETDPATAVYHHAPSGVYIEVVDLAVRQWLFGDGEST